MPCIRSRVAVPVVVLLLLAAVAVGSDDRLELANGDVVSGTIVRMDTTTVVIHTEFGVLEIPRERVLRGFFGDAPSVAPRAEDDEGGSPVDDGPPDGRGAEDAGPLLHFPLDGTLDDAAGSRVLTNNGMIFASDRDATRNGALRSTGGGTYLSVAPDAALNELSAFTLAFFIRPDRQNGTRYFASKWDRADGERAEGKFTLQTTDGGLTLFLVAPDGRYHWLSARGVLQPLAWQHVAVSFAGGRAAFYVDGDEVRSRLFAFTDLAADESPLLFMTAEARTDERFSLYNATGSIDDIRLYDRALAPEEIASLAAERE